ncbi:hypothetical protein AUK22_01780 [bacterium CG2_30_54_10]|nr:MAG: hypothetical protein AUK22_01780 [bacterium CG2_30_54_10]
MVGVSAYLTLSDSVIKLNLNSMLLITRSVTNMRYLSRFLVLTIVLGCIFFQAGPASAKGLGDWLDEANATLDRVNDVLGGTFAGPNPDYKPTPTVQTPTADNFLGGLETSAEKSMGKSSHDAFRKKPGFVKDKAMLARVGRIARRLVPVVERKELTYTFAVLDTDEINAFGAPGGYIYVTKGLMKAIQTDDELAGVIGHELGHVNKKHSIRQAEKAGLMTAAVALLGLKDQTKKYAAAAAVAAFLANQKFSRDDEFEADKVSVSYTYKAGYNPNGLIRFFNRINKDNSLSKVTKYFSTHPPTNDRITRVKAEIIKVSGHSAEELGNGTLSGNSPTGSSPNNSNPVPPIVNRPSADQLKAAYEVYLYKKQVYEYTVSQGAPYNDVMKAFNEYQAAKQRYAALQRAASAR